jgi:hypothetical protein
MSKWVRMTIWVLKTQVMAKRRIKSQIAKFARHHQKSRIAMIYLHAGGVQHIFKKLSTWVIVLLQTSLHSEVCTKNYGPPKPLESQFGNLKLGVSKRNNI